MLLTKLKTMFKKSLLLFILCSGHSSLYANQATNLPADPSNQSHLVIPTPTCTTVPNLGTLRDKYLVSAYANILASDHDREVEVGAGFALGGVDNAFARLKTSCSQDPSFWKKVPA